MERVIGDSSRGGRDSREVGLQMICVKRSLGQSPLAVKAAVALAMNKK